jgi:tRNA(Ile)-lysidine synthase TilS/MesJ
MENYRLIEKSIIKKYRKEIWSKFVKAIKEYDLIKENDKIAVCISGGKDSFLLAKCLEELQRHGKFKFDLEYLVMDPGFTKDGLKIIKKNAKTLNIPIKVFKSTIFKDVMKEDSPCYVCARKRRGHLYNYAKKLGCNKIALGHHFDDVIETTLLSIIYGGEVKGMLPKLKSTNYEGMELIRPLFFVQEKDIISWKKYNNLEFINCCCPLNTTACETNSDSKRLEIKNLIKSLEQKNEFIKYNIFKSMTNVNLNTILGYNKDKVEHSFLDDYDKE